MSYSLQDDKPIFQQIAEAIEAGILEGFYKTGDRVPSTNEFAKHYQINPATAAKGINQLVDQEILFKKRGIGMFVTEKAPEIILAKRQERFFHDYVLPLKKEAAAIGLSQDEIIHLLSREES